MDELLAEFLAEAQESIAKLDNELVVLESNPEDQNVIGSVFRIIHTIKGTSGFLALGKLEKVAHSGENLMNKIRDGSMKATSDVLTIIFKSIDTIKGILETISETGAEPEENFQGLIDEIARACNSEAPIANPSPASTETPVDGEFIPGEDPFAEIIAQYEQEQKAASSPPQPTEPPIAKKIAEVPPTKNENKSNATESIRVRLSLLDKLMQTVSELVLSRNQLLQISRSQYNANSPYNTPVQHLSIITTELQENMMKTRMQPVSNIWSTYPRIVRDLSNDLGKKIHIQLEGEETELDRHMLELIKDPLIHMLRNSVDHGIEKPEERIANDKDEAGKITIRAVHQGGHVLIQIVDDGKGLDFDRVKAKALEKGLATEKELAEMSDQQISAFIFAPGFSTAQQVSAVSGRGVGMDVVKTNVEKIGGTIELTSQKGKGTTFTLKIPLTLAIMPTLIIGTGDLRFAIPMTNVIEILKVNCDGEYKIELLNDSPILRIRDSILPLLLLSDTLEISSQPHCELVAAKKFIVIIKVIDISYGLIIDRVYDIEEIVVKPVSQPLKCISKYSGTTILGDGSVIMILDPNSFTDELTDISTAHVADSMESFLEVYRREQRVFSNLLLFKVTKHDGSLAVPLEMVNRIEEIPATTIEQISNELVVQYRDSLMKLIKIDPSIEPNEDNNYEVIVFNDGTSFLGLIVGEIQDIIKHEFDNKHLDSQDPRFMQAVVINDKTTEVIDVSYFYKQAFGNNFKTDSKEDEQKSRHIMLVDDSAFFRKFIPPAIRNAGYEVTTVDTVEAAIELLESNLNFAAIITDINMPGKGGVDLVKFCKSLEKMNKTPVIALSAYSVEEAIKDKTIANYFDAFIPKTHHSKLLETLSELVV